MPSFPLTILSEYILYIVVLFCYVLEITILDNFTMQNSGYLFIYRMLSWIEILNIRSVPSFSFFPARTPIIHMMALLCLSSISTTFSLAFFTCFFIRLIFSSLFACFSSMVLIKLLFKSILPLIPSNLVCISKKINKIYLPFYSISFLSSINFNFISSFFS